MTKERFMSKVSLVPCGGCWLWEGGVQSRGYGELWLDGRMVLAHRYSYEAFVGPIPAGLQIDHLCRVKSCVNPTHLEPVTASENQRRVGPRAKSPTCPSGHSDWLNYAGQRVCRTCKNLRERDRRRRRAA